MICSGRGRTGRGKRTASRSWRTCCLRWSWGGGVQRREFGLLSNAAHPGYARTNLQTSGPGGPLNPVEKIIPIEKIMASFMSQDAAHGALPTLRAATAMDSAQGSYYAPDRMFELKGDPVLVPVPKPARNEAVARRLWEVSLGLTGGSFAGL